MKLKIRDQLDAVIFGNMLHDAIVNDEWYDKMADVSDNEFVFNSNYLAHKTVFNNERLN